MNRALGSGDETQNRLLAGFQGLDEEGGRAARGAASSPIVRLLERFGLGGTASTPAPKPIPRSDWSGRPEDREAL